MLLKKQTVWLLTMLSLVIVLSVYYVTSPSENQKDMAADVKNGDKLNSQNGKETSVEDGKGIQSKMDDAVPTGGDETFETLRLEVTDKRNKLVEELTVLMSNTELSAKERVEAQETIKQLQEMTEKETILETLIVQMNYDDALVRADHGDIQVTVKAKELSKTAANDIMRLVSAEMPNAKNINVEYQPSK